MSGAALVTPAADEESFYQDSYLALMNILDDAASERMQMQDMHRGMFNLLEDFEAESQHGADVQRAILNILEDFDSQRVALAQQVNQTKSTNHELQETLKNLSETQRQLIRTEKLSSLGGLVAGIAHEINTPIGISVTAASTLQGSATDLRNKFEEGTLKQSELNRFIEIFDEATAIILTSLGRAAELMHGFKQVAVDQTSGERRKFYMKHYLDEVLISLKPLIKKTTHHVDVECSDDLEIDGYPGAISQILTNLINNSITHGFEDQKNGQIRVAVTQEGDTLILQYSDNGCGLQKEHLNRMFEPFFTTKRGRGGSGLGMHLVYNLVTQLMSGSVDAISEPGQGVMVIIRLPMIAP